MFKKWDGLSEDGPTVRIKVECKLRNGKNWTGCIDELDWSQNGDEPETDIIEYRICGVVEC